MISQISGRLVHRPAVNHSNAAPCPQQLGEIRRYAGSLRALPFGAYQSAVHQIFFKNLLLNRVKRAFVPPDGMKHLGAFQQFLDLKYVISLDFGCRIDGAEAAADNQRRQTDLQIGEAVLPGRPGELQGHEKIAGLADTVRQFVFDLNHRGFAGTRR